MISALDRQQAVELIEEAHAAGASGAIGGGQRPRRSRPSTPPIGRIGSVRYGFGMGRGRCLPRTLNNMPYRIARRLNRSQMEQENTCRSVDAVRPIQRSSRLFPPRFPDEILRLEPLAAPCP